MKNPLLNKDFLKELDLTSLKEVYAEIFSLNKNGEILESIEGRVSKGTLNVDGNSSNDLYKQWLVIKASLSIKLINGYIL